MEDLRGELVEIIRKEQEPLVERWKRDAEMSDDEWWEKTLESAEAFPELRARMAENKEEMVRHRFRPNPDTAVQRRTDDLLPFLIQVRAEGGMDGPVTQDQYRAAIHKSSQASMAAALDKMRDHVLNKPDAPNTWVIRKLLENAERDSKLMSAMLANPTEERNQAFADQVCKGLQEITAEMMRRRGEGR